jgi:hypothetical protein
LPPGLDLDASSGVIAGTPSASGAWTFTVAATDQAKQVNNLTYTLPVGAGQNLPRFGVLSHIASGGGWVTTLYFVNQDSKSQPLHVAFWGDDGQPLSLPVTVVSGGQSQTLTATSVDQTLAPNAMVLIQSAATTASASSGWAECLGSPMIAGFGVFGYTPASGPASEAAVSLETAFNQSFLVPYESSRQFSTGIGLANLRLDAAAAITATVYDENGAQIAQQSMSLPAAGHTSFLLTDKFPAAAGHFGFVSFSGTGAGLLTGLGIRVNPEGTFTSAPRLDNQ